MAKTVAERAAELGTDQLLLVRALKALSHWKIVSGKRTRRGGYYSYRPHTALMSVDDAAAMLGVDLEDAKQAIENSPPIAWTREKILAALFAFHKEHGRMPVTRELRSANGLPSPRIYAWQAGRAIGNFDIRPRDAWERVMAQDRRCGPEMAIRLRNTLARKEAIERIGFEKFIKQGFAEVIDEHSEFGVLYRLPGETSSEPMVLLKVVNSTPGPDGTFADYYLRVPPDQRDVRKALTWTFNRNEALGGKPYAPLVET